MATHRIIRMRRAEAERLLEELEHTALTTATRQWREHLQLEPDDPDWVEVQLHHESPDLARSIEFFEIEFEVVLELP